MIIACWRPGGGRVGQIGDQHASVGAECGGEVFQTISPARQQDHGMAGRVKLPRQVGANAG